MTFIVIEKYTGESEFLDCFANCSKKLNTIFLMYWQTIITHERLIVCFGEKLNFHHPRH